MLFANDLREDLLLSASDKGSTLSASWHTTSQMTVES